MRSMAIKSEVLLTLLLVLSALTFFAKGSSFYYTQGIIAFNAGDYAQAEKYLKTALILNPSLENNSDIKYMIGLSAWYAGDLVTARAYLPKEQFSMLASSTRLSKRNLVSEIAKWESLSSPIINVESQNEKKKIPKSVAFLIFFGFFSSIMGGFFAYKFSKKLKKRPRKKKEVESEEEFVEEEIPFETSAPAREKITEMPVNGPDEDEIRKKLQNLLKMDIGDEERVQIVEEPEKIVENTGVEASQEDIEKVEEAVQELLSKESQNVET